MLTYPLDMVRARMAVTPKEMWGSTECAHRENSTNANRMIQKLRFLSGISLQVQQHSACVCADIPRRGAKDSVPRLRPHHPGCGALRWSQLLHLWDAEESSRRSVLLPPASLFLPLTLKFDVSPHRPLPHRAKRALPAVLVRTFGVRGLRRPDWSVSVIPSGRGTTPHADSGSHRPHVQHHPGHHEGDSVWGGGDTWTLQRPEHELGQRAHRRGD